VQIESRHFQGSPLKLGPRNGVLTANMKRCLLNLACCFLFTLLCSDTFANEDREAPCQLITINDLKGKDAPKYETFPTQTVSNLKPAKVNLKSHPRASRYRTRIREGAAKGPNFAGHFTIIGWGCGTSCVQWAITDAQTGSVYFPPDEIASISTVHVITAEDESEPHFYGLRFRKDSTLLMILGAPNEYDSREGILFYQWTGRAFKFLKAYRIQRDWQKCAER
jgi:hypothetical protein